MKKKGKKKGGEKNKKRKNPFPRAFPPVFPREKTRTSPGASQRLAVGGPHPGGDDGTHRRAVGTRTSCLVVNFDHPTDLVLLGGRHCSGQFSAQRWLLVPQYDCMAANRGHPRPPPSRPARPRPPSPAAAPRWSNLGTLVFPPHAGFSAQVIGRSRYIRRRRHPGCKRCSGGFRLPPLARLPHPVRVAISARPRPTRCPPAREHTLATSGSGSNAHGHHRDAGRFAQPLAPIYSRATPAQ